MIKINRYWAIFPILIGASLWLYLYLSGPTENKLTRIAFAPNLIADKQFTFFLLGSGSCSLDIDFGDRTPIAHLSDQLPFEGQHNYFENDFKNVDKNSKNYSIVIKTLGNCKNLVNLPVIAHVTLPSGCKVSPCKKE